MPINPTPHVHSPYGAPMGRPSYGHGASPTTPFELRRIRINNGGYDDGGAYWGLGQPLYWYCAYEVSQGCMCDPTMKLHSEGCELTGQSIEYGDETEISDYIRANDREHAKAIIRAKYPEAKFKR